MKRNFVLDALVGISVGDALGVPVEFKTREYLESNPVTDILGFGTHNQRAGTWSDDSSLSFCLSESLCYGFDIGDIAAKFVMWYYDNYWTPYGVVFDVGGTTSEAIRKIKSLKYKPENCGGKEIMDNGNGSLMRILPIAFYVKDLTLEEKYEITSKVSSITHAHKISTLSCCIYIDFAINLIDGLNKIEALKKTKQNINEFFKNENYINKFYRILDDNIYELDEVAIKSSGYVIDTLEASIWCFINGNSFEECVLKAVNLGNDTDTIGAITGGLAGLYYGFINIPKKWVNTLARKDDIFDLANRLSESI